jgi:hypothetical protein
MCRIASSFVMMSRRCSDPASQRSSSTCRSSGVPARPGNCSCCKLTLLQHLHLRCLILLLLLYQLPLLLERLLHAHLQHCSSTLHVRSAAARTLSNMCIDTV